MIEWARGWRPFRTDENHQAMRRYLERTLGWELSENPGHPLYGRKFEGIGRCNAYDDMLVRLDDRDEFAWVRLSWRGETGPDVPLHKVLGDVAATNRFLADWMPVPFRGQLPSPDADEVP